MTPSATDRSSATVSAVTPLPTRSGTSATALRTRLTSARGVAWPVARLDAARREGHVVEVLDEHRVDAALDQGAGIRERRSHDARHRPVPPRAAGQGREVDHADDRALELHQR